ncbi:hypothetical protein [Agrobacterium sp.]|uniref:hypothetical protein n=1 Tax=Agrobacterium sp. TaxID=361 RepID=UPI0028A729FF
MKRTTQTTGNASAAGAEQMYDLADKLSGLCHDLSCLAYLLDHEIDDVLNPGVHPDGKDGGYKSFYYIPPSTKQGINFLVTKVGSAINDIDGLSNELVGKATEHRQMLTGTPHMGEA